MDHHCTDNKKPILLIHGAWYTPEVWSDVKVGLEEIGYKVYTPELPYYQEGTSERPVTRHSFIHSVISPLLDKAIEASNGAKPILVGHSLAGTIIAETADIYPDKISALVFLAGFLLTNEMSIMDVRKYRNREKQVEIGAVISQGKIRSKSGKSLPVAVLDQNTALSRFAQDCSEEQQAELMQNMCWKMPELLIKAPLKIGSNYAQIPRYYIKTLQDRGVSIEEQEGMIKASGCQKVWAIDSGHSPFINKASEVVESIDKISHIVEAQESPSLSLLGKLLSFLKKSEEGSRDSELLENFSEKLSFKDIHY